METQRSAALSRRQILTAACGLALSTPLSARAARSGARHSIRLGGPVFEKSEDPGAWVAAHQTLGYRAAFAPPLELEETERIRAFVQESSRQDLVIAEVGAWVNLVDLDPDKRKANREFVSRRLALADELGALCCVDISGSYHPEIWDAPHPENFSPRFFDETVEVVRHLIDSVRPRRTRFSIEMMGWTVPSSAEEYLRLIRAVDRSAFAVHVDVCNMINSPARIYRNADLIREAFSRLGPWIVSCHAKDVAWVLGSQVHFREVIPGRGELDYAVYLQELAGLEQDAPILLEHLKSPEEYLEGADYIRSVGRQAGIDFG